MDKVFVYGTLKIGRGNHFFLNNAPYMGDDIVDFQMYNLGAFPMIRGDVEGESYGEIYEVDEVVLQALDRLEGHPHFYQRILVETRKGKEVWLYVASETYKEQCVKEVTNGIWL